ncbi:MAG: FAD-dependent pyridine nucleotide-disulfide oxidoreductase [archaeon GW2011_AR10]|nr:MAG: FAD-dependent pyridine nucleotide-disulfide oxidoreductase [archaeon GW2011_AR10]
MGFIMVPKQIVILGGGAGGLVAANELRKKLGTEHRIVVIDKNSKHVFQPSLLWLMIGQRKPEKIQKELSLLTRKGIEFINDEVKEISISEKSVKTGKGAINFDYLIISLGADLAAESIKGLKESGFNLYSIDSVSKLGKELEKFTDGKIVVLIAGTPFKCPAAPYEAAMLLDYYFKKKGIREKIDLEVCTPETLPMPAAGPEVGNGLKMMLEERNIKFSPEVKVISVDPKKKTINFEGSKNAGFDLLLFVPPHSAPRVVRDADLTNESGWVPVDMKTLRTRHENVFAIGDITAIKLSDGKMLPKAGVFAHFQAEVISNNIAAEILGLKSLKEFNGYGFCFVEIGHGKAAYGGGNFYAEPRKINLKGPNIILHWAKVLFEKYWFWKWF